MQDLFLTLATQNSRNRYTWGNQEIVVNQRETKLPTEYSPPKPSWARCHHCSLSLKARVDRQLKLRIVSVTCSSMLQILSNTENK